MERLLPRFKWGNILPKNGGIRRGPGYQFYRLVPLDIMEISIALGLEEYTKAGVQKAIGNFSNCVNALAKEKVDIIILGGAPISSQLGMQEVRRLLAETKQKTGINADAPLEAVIAGMNHLGAKSIVIGSRWADELNQAMASYLTEGGVQVAGVTSRGQWAAQAFGMSLEEGMRMALEVGREAARLAPNADAILVPGGAAMSVHVIPALEEEFGKPVFTNLNAEIWHNIVHTGVIGPVQGWGKLMATP